METPVDFVNGDPYGFIFLSKANNKFVNAYKELHNNTKIYHVWYGSQGVAHSTNLPLQTTSASSKFPQLCTPTPRFVQLVSWSSAPLQPTSSRKMGPLGRSNLADLPSAAIEELMKPSGVINNSWFSKHIYILTTCEVGIWAYFQNKYCNSWQHRHLFKVLL